MLTSLRIQNFKAWKDTGEVRLAPLTVLFGTNSAGKTSIPQLLLLLKQTAESSDRQRALHLGDSRTLVDVGTYEEAVHGRRVSEAVQFSLGWSLEQPLCVRDPLSATAYAGEEMVFSARLEADAKRQPRTTSLRYELRDHKGCVLDLEFGAKPRAPRRNAAAFELRSERYPLARHPGRTSPLPGPLRFYGFPDEVTAYYQNAAFAADFVLELEHLLKSVYYVGPLREYPKRLYLWSGEAPDHVGVKGERTIEALLSSGDRHFSWKPKQKDKTLQQLVAERLKMLGLIHTFRLEPIARHRREYEVLVQTSPRSPEVKLTDVGFGVSHVLPVIVECFYVPRRSVVILEQPELHLHPRVQSELADLFVDAIRAREDGAPRQCQFIIESHSEHFLRRLQRRIAEEELSNRDAALYFVHTTGAEARIEALEVDPFGNIKNWPENFFGDEMADLVARSEAQAKRMRKAGPR